MLPWGLEHRGVLNTGFLKSCVYAGKPGTFGELKTAIRENIQEIDEETLVKV